ncbi:hypothetical protein CXG81DRAFT_23080 [Caulochytrium protostelioides]|uniref:Response regulatory domain-containing protein n=1 Tax=Caulochytrium protostelioides TaxID=1555241 RepID=A0A4P9XFG2_9FUNG|nr:hypothetical protein CXG81DRAFT_23080 [Caulochytrium protostelioides]|eukprot:RKP04304.1 hypothetical protein CXG81DRAFT_23080 [Caulochytrium protostelioides]
MTISATTPSPSPSSSLSPSPSLFCRPSPPRAGQDTTAPPQAPGGRKTPLLQRRHRPPQPHAAAAGTLSPSEPSRQDERLDVKGSTRPRMLWPTIELPPSLLATAKVVPAAEANAPATTTAAALTGLASPSGLTTPASLLEPVGLMTTPASVLASPLQTPMITALPHIGGTDPFDAFAASARRTPRTTPETSPARDRGFRGTPPRSLTPAAASAAAGAADARASADAATPLTTYRIAVCDDNPLNRVILERMVKHGLTHYARTHPPAGAPTFPSAGTSPNLATAWPESAAGASVTPTATPTVTPPRKASSSAPTSANAKTGTGWSMPAAAVGGGGGGGGGGGPVHIHVDCHPHGLACVNATQQHRYAVILMDINMGIMDGVTATRAIRHPHAEITSAMTALAYEQLEQQTRSTAGTAGTTTASATAAASRSLTPAAAATSTETSSSRCDARWNPTDDPFAQFHPLAQPRTQTPSQIPAQMPSQPQTPASASAASPSHAVNAGAAAATAASASGAPPRRMKHRHTQSLLPHQPPNDLEAHQSLELRQRLQELASSRDSLSVSRGSGSGGTRPLHPTLPTSAATASLASVTATLTPTATRGSPLYGIEESLPPQTSSSASSDADGAAGADSDAPAGAADAAATARLDARGGGDAATYNSMTPILAVTSNTDAVSEALFLGAGMQTVIAKPIHDRSRFLETVWTYLTMPRTPCDPPPASLPSSSSSSSSSLSSSSSSSSSSSPSSSPSSSSTSSTSSTSSASPASSPPRASPRREYPPDLLGAHAFPQLEDDHMLARAADRSPPLLRPRPSAP